MKPRRSSMRASSRLHGGGWRVVEAASNISPMQHYEQGYGGTLHYPSPFTVEWLRGRRTPLALSARLAAAEQAGEKVVKHGLLLSPGGGTRAVLLERIPAPAAAPTAI